MGKKRFSRFVHDVQKHDKDLFGNKVCQRYVIGYTGGVTVEVWAMDSDDAERIANRLTGGKLLMMSIEFPAVVGIET